MINNYDEKEKELARLRVELHNLKILSKEYKQLVDRMLLGAEPSGMDIQETIDELCKMTGTVITEREGGDDNNI